MFPKQSSDQLYFITKYRLISNYLTFSQRITLICINSFSNSEFEVFLNENQFRESLIKVLLHIQYSLFNDYKMFVLKYELIR